LFEQENTKEAPLSEEKPVEEVTESPKAPKPTATGNEKITILKHGVYIKAEQRGEVEKAGVELAIRNVSDKTIGTAVFEAVFYGKEGNILDTVEHKTFELQPKFNRTISIASAGPARDKVESYNVRLVKTTMPPAPTATGNEKIAILKHNLSPMGDMSVQAYCVSCVGAIHIELAIRNVSDLTIATAVFEAIFYDIEGNILDTVEHKTFDLKPNTSRSVGIGSLIPEYHKVKSYHVKITRMTTTDVEKVQLRRHERSKTETGEEEIKGIVKNISEVKTDATLIATFYNTKKENIGTRVLTLRDIEPDSIKQFDLKFKPQEGDRVINYSLTIGEIVE
jgi:hypothetical protein